MLSWRRSGGNAQREDISNTPRLFESSVLGEAQRRRAGDVQGPLQRSRAGCPSHSRPAPARLSRAPVSFRRQDRPPTFAPCRPWSCCTRISPVIIALRTQINPVISRGTGEGPRLERGTKTTRARQDRRGLRSRCYEWPNAPLLDQPTGLQDRLIKRDGCDCRSFRPSGPLGLVIKKVRCHSCWSQRTSSRPSDMMGNVL